MKFLLEYVREIFLEGRRDDLRKKTLELDPEIDFHLLWYSDPSSTKKYIEWMLKQAGLTNDRSSSWYQRLQDAIVFFHENNKKFHFKSRDINRYKSLDDLETDIRRIKMAGPTKTDLRRSASAGAKKIHENTTATLYRIETKEAAQVMGRGTKWCITMAEADYYENYTNAGAYFYYIIKKDPKQDCWDKMAVSIVKPGYDIESIEMFDATDDRIDSHDIDLATNGAEFVQICKKDVMNNKPKVVWLVKNGEPITESQAREYWASLNTDNKKMIALEKKISKDSYKYFLPIVDEKYKLILQKYTPNPGIYAGNELVLRQDEDQTEFPTRIGIDNMKVWCKPGTSGTKHRIGGPAEICDAYEKWYINGFLQSQDDKPAVVYKNGSREWYDHGKLHRKGSPARILEGDDSRQESWYNFGERHREDGPAEIYYKNGKKAETKWYLNGKLGRNDDGPTSTVFNITTGYPYTQEWHDAKTGHLADRFPEPSRIYCYPDGMPYIEEFYKNGALVGEREYDKEGNIKQEVGSLFKKKT